MEDYVEPTVDDMLTAFGVATETTETTAETTTETAATETTTETTPATETTTAPETEAAAKTETATETKTTTEPAPAPDKQAYAFAQLRNENATTKALLKDIAGVLGITDLNETTLPEALKTKVQEAIAKQKNLPVEIVRDLEHLKERDAAYTADQNRNAALLGFQKVKDTFHFSDEALNKFAADLNGKGKNPFVEPFDLVAAYKLDNFDLLVQQAAEKARTEEAQRAAKATQQGTETGAKTGGTTDPAGKINTVDALNSYFSTLKI